MSYYLIGLLVALILLAAYARWFTIALRHHNQKKEIARQQQLKAVQAKAAEGTNSSTPAGGR